MSESTRCQRCDRELPKNGLLDGCCPHCMLGLGLVPASGETIAAAVTSESHSGVLTRPVAIGRYRIVRLIAQGGMGAIYEAEQDQPRRTVALKIIKPGMATPDLLRRFEQESQALGRLQHPGIAQIYDAGTVDTGYGPQPYFAMELIRGGHSPREYAEIHHLNTRQRLEMMKKICDAVHHAHQRGIIHRDLKPGNILIDESGLPKVLDFGVARVADSDARVTLQTDAGQLVGTLAYMSPEQALADPLDIDTRTDVYALGVILYELLTGRLPHAVSKSLHETILAIREKDPPRLGTLNRAYRGDLETIVAKSMEKDRTRRYAAAAGMALDIDRYLGNEPIAARPPTASYQLQKFARRHSVFVVGVASVFLVLLAGVILTTSQALRAGRAEEQIKLALERVEATGRLSIMERDRALEAQKTAIAAQNEAQQDRDRADWERRRADAEAAVSKEQRVFKIWRSLSYESVRESTNRVDDDRAALLARQALLMHAVTPGKEQYLVEEALQKASSLNWWGHFIPISTTSLAFSPDGSLLATVGLGRESITIFDLRNPAALPLLLEGHDGPVHAVTFSPDGTHLVSGGADKTVRIWDLSTPGAEPAMLKGRQDVIRSVAVSPDGVRLAAGGDETLQIWDLSTPGAEPILIEGLRGRVPSVTFSPDGARLAYGNGNTVRVWDLHSPNAPVVVLPGTSQGSVNSVAFSPGGDRLASASVDSTVRVWDLRNPNAPPTLLAVHRPQSSVTAIALSPDGLRLASGSDMWAMAYPMSGPVQPYPRVLVLLGHQQH